MRSNRGSVTYSVVVVNHAAFTSRFVLLLNVGCMGKVFPFISTENISIQYLCSLVYFGIFLPSVNY